MNKALRFLSPALVLGPALTCVAPRIMALLFVVSCLGTLIADYLYNRHRPVPDKSLFAIIFGVIGYGFISWLWTISPDVTTGKAAQIAVTLGMVPFMAPFIARLSLSELRYLGWMLAGGLILGLIIHLSELATHFALYDMLHPGNTDVPDNKQNKASVLVLLWLLLTLPFLVLTKGDRRKQRFRVFIVSFIGVAVAVAATKSMATQVIFASLPFFALALYFLPARLSLTLAFAGVVALTTAMPLIAISIHDYTDWRRPGQISNSIISRIEIWNQFSTRALERPIAGWGLDSSADMPGRAEYSILTYGTRRTMIKHMHPHNAPIQIWFEMGAIGVLGFLGLFTMLYFRLRRAAPLIQQYAVFAGVTLFLFTLAIWGIWQTWFIATLTCTGLMIYGGTRYLREAV